RALVLSGEPLPRLARETKIGNAVFEIYGTTETGAIATRTTASTSQYRFLDGVHVDTVADRQQVHGGHVHEPVHLNDRLLHMEGDCFDLEGRLSDMVKIGGKRASLSALSLELAAIPGVLDGVFFVPDPQSYNARLSAFVVAPNVADHDIIAALRKRVDPVFLPRPLIRVGQLPRNATGKLTRDSMADLAARAREHAIPEHS
ncbi:MAG TPA: beta-hydroxyacyl-ACP dehydratase, partial [Burkholderiales bacterium]|nr:beta-hydroxyacyl-ACP dehydratase [Burkholderiales bacterium]